MSKKNIRKKYLIIVSVLLILVLVGTGSYFWKTKAQKSTSNVTNSTTTTSSTENVQSTNPYEKTNPFYKMKVNPFE